MADPAAVVIGQAVHGLAMEFRAARMAEKITDFSGESGRRFADWLRDIERNIATTPGATDDVIRVMVCLTLKGAAAEFFARIVTENPDATWAQLRTLLRAQYCDEADRHIALQKLRLLRQKKDENVQAFCERIRKMAKEAYPDIDDLEGNVVIQNALIDRLIEGTSNDGIARKLIRSRPETFNAAVERAVREQMSLKHFKLSRQEEDMEVDSVASSSQFDVLIHKLEGLAAAPSKVDKLDAILARIEKLEGRAPHPSPQRRDSANPKTNTKRTPKWTPDGKPICLYCDKIGHKIADCRKKRFDSRGSAPPQPPKN